MKVKLVFKKRSWNQPQKNIVLRNYTLKKSCHGMLKSLVGTVDWIGVGDFPSVHFRSRFFVTACFRGEFLCTIFLRCCFQETQASLLFCDTSVNFISFTEDGTWVLPNTQWHVEAFGEHSEQMSQTAILNCESYIWWLNRDLNNRAQMFKLNKNNFAVYLAVKRHVRTRRNNQGI